MVVPAHDASSAAPPATPSATERDTLYRVLGSSPARVVDLGGGTGGLAVALAAAGHRVTVVDPSPNALAALARRAADAGVTAAVNGLLGDASTLSGLVAEASVDLAVCHGVLGVVDDPSQALQALARVVRVGGHLSVLVPQRSGAVVAAVLSGRLDDAAALLDEDESGPPRRFSLDQIEGLVAHAGFDVVEVHGMRVFSDHVAQAARGGPAVGLDERLARLEDAVRCRADFLPLATQLHLVAVRR